MRTLLAAAIAAFAALPAWAGSNAWTALPDVGPKTGQIVKIVADPGNGQLRYAATQGGVYVSRNGGLSWQAGNAGIVPTPAGYLMVNDLALAGGSLYITPMFLQKSTDGGSSWSRTGWVTENPQALVLAVDPHNAALVYAGSNQGVYKSSDAGVSWRYLAGNSPVYALAVDPNNANTVFRGVASGIYRSNDGGLNWAQVSTLIARTIAVDPRNSQRVYVGTGGAGVWTSSDGGSSWSAINRCIPQDRCAPTNLDGAWVTSIVFGGGGSSTLYLGTGSGLYKSVDGGANWTQANNGPIAVDTMMLDPLQADTLIAGYGAKLYSYTFAAATDSDRIFNWAEALYPQFFAPAGAVTQSISGYQARAYAGTGTYLGTTNGRVYVYGAIFGGLVDVGAVADLLPLAAAAGY